MARKLFVLLAVTFALAMVNARLMSVRNSHAKFELLDRADGNQPHEFRLALKQKNIDVLEVILTSRLILLDRKSASPLPQSFHGFANLKN
jgi:hypothetical protein